MISTDFCFVLFFRVKDIQSVYLDTTFCDPKFYQIPSRVRLPGERGWSYGHGHILVGSL